MTNDAKIIITQETRDLSLVDLLVEIKATQSLLLALYAKTFQRSLEQADKDLGAMRLSSFDRVQRFLVKHGDLDVPGLLESLDL